MNIFYNFKQATHAHTPHTHTANLESQRTFASSCSARSQLHFVPNNK